MREGRQNVDNGWEQGTTRRGVLKMAGAGLLTFGAVSSGTERAAQAAGPSIDPTFGYSGRGLDFVPWALLPDHTVELMVDEEKFIIEDGHVVGAKFGAFHFHPTGLHVSPGDIVGFKFNTPMHTITAYHPKLGRQARVPVAVPPFSSPVIEKNGFWLYRFEEPGVYDLFCAPHELVGMGMRIVVGDKTGPVVWSEGEPPFVLAATLLGTGMPGDDGERDIGVDALDPQNIIDQGSILAEDLHLDLAVRIPQPVKPSDM